MLCVLYRMNAPSFKGYEYVVAKIFAYDPIKVSNYAAKVYTGQRGFVHYGFGDDQVDFDIIKALGSITKKIR